MVSLPLECLSSTALGYLQVLDPVASAAHLSRFLLILQDSPKHHPLGGTFPDPTRKVSFFTFSTLACGLQESNSIISWGPEGRDSNFLCVYVLNFSFV